MTFLGSVLGSRGTGKSPIRRHGTGRACTDYDSRWLTHSFWSHTSFPCHDQPRLNGKTGRKFKYANQALVGMTGFMVYYILFNYAVDFHLVTGMIILGASDITFIDAPFFSPLCCRFAWRGRVSMSTVFKKAILRDMILNLSFETSSDI